MNAEIIAIGSELLMGQIANTNAQYISQKMAELGINIYHHSVVGDNMSRIVEAMGQASERSDIVFLSGGLGPTQDDITKWALAEFAEVEMIEDKGSRERIDKIFRARQYGEPTENNYRQAMFPVGAQIIENDYGTAPGCSLKVGETAFYVMPGPPLELIGMFESKIASELEKKMDSRIVSKFLRVFGVGESSLENDIKSILDEQTNPSIAMYAGKRDITLRVTARVGMGEDSRAILQPTIEKLDKILGDLIFSYDDENMSEVVVRQLLKDSETLSLAESLTGGMIASSIVENAGASKVLFEGRVAYTTEAKMRLGVPSEIIKKYGSVSEECAIAMAKSIL